MLESLGKITNPALRSLTSGLVACSAFTMLSAVVLGFSNPKNESLHKLAVYGAGIAAVGGAAFGLTVNQKPQQSNTLTQQALEIAWQDWRNFVVLQKVKESTEITSFYLQPQDQGMLPSYQPGQFLTIKLDIPEQKRPVIRTYSLSDYAQLNQCYRISVKRESAPPDLDVPPGVASNFLHDHIQEGTIIQCKPPNGKFYLDVSASTPVVLISNGVGITPMMAMAKALAFENPQRRVWFVHGARNGEYHAFREDILTLAQNFPNLQIHYCYSRPRSEDDGKYHSQGYVDLALLKELVGNSLPDSNYFLCGSPAFMDSIIKGLKSEKIAENQIFFESFSKSKSTTPKSEVKEATAEVVCTESNQTLTWNSQNGSILELAEANNLNPPYSCRAGICLTCMCKLEEGEVEYEEPPVGTTDPGHVLICVGKPKTSRVVLKL